LQLQGKCKRLNCQEKIRISSDGFSRLLSRLRSDSIFDTEEIRIEKPAYRLRETVSYVAMDTILQYSKILV